jgi:hypothetical protein
MSTLYDLSAKYQQVYEMDDIDPEVWTDTLLSIDDAIEDKADGYAAVIKMYEGDNAAVKKEIERLQKIMKRNDNRVKAMKLNLQDSMTSLGKDKFSTTLNTFRIQNNPPSVQKIDESKLPERFVTVEEVKKIDKKAIIAEWKDTDKQIEGAEVVQTRSLRIA